jgi:hypothetical protein
MGLIITLCTCSPLPLCVCLVLHVLPGLQDGVKVEYEDELPLHLFAVRIPFAWVHQLPEILEMLLRDPDRIQRMRKNMK